MLFAVKQLANEPSYRTHGAIQTQFADNGGCFVERLGAGVTGLDDGDCDRQIQTGLPNADEVLTNFERKARIKGGNVWRAAYQIV